MTAKKKTARLPGFVGDDLAMRMSRRIVAPSKRKSAMKSLACNNALDRLVWHTIDLTEAIERKNMSQKDVNLMAKRAAAARDRITKACGCRR